MQEGKKQKWTQMNWQLNQNVGWSLNDSSLDNHQTTEWYIYKKGNWTHTKTEWVEIEWRKVAQFQCLNTEQGSIRQGSEWHWRTNAEAHQFSPLKNKVKLNLPKR